MLLRASYLLLSPSASLFSHSSPDPDELLEDEDDEDRRGDPDDLLDSESLGFLATFLNSESDTSESELLWTLSRDFLFSASLILAA